jgi:NSS family neurotransmitter:Na+ symporter
MQDELSNSGELHNTSVVSVVFRLVRWVTPVLVLLVMLNGLGVIKLG